MKLIHPRRSPALLALALSLGAASGWLALVPATVALARDAVAPGKYQDWRELDEAEILQVFRLGDYRSLVIAPVDPKGAELPEKSDNAYAPVMKVLANLTSTFASGVRERAPGGVSVTQGNGGGAGALVIRARVAFILPGSAAARGFGGLAGKIAGAARVGLAGDVVDGKTNKVLFRFKTKRSSSGGMFGGDYEKLLNESAKEVGNDVGNALKAF